MFNERLTALIKAKGFSQKELSKRANITESAMSYYVKGIRTPSGEVLARIARALNTTTDYLLGNTDIADAPEINERLIYLQRNLCQLDERQLKKAEKLLQLVFDDVFEDHGGVD